MTIRTKPWVVPILLLGTTLVLITSCNRRPSIRTSGNKQYRIGVTLLTKSHPFYQEMEAAMRETASKYNVELNIQSAEGRVDNQQIQIENFLAQGVDALVVCPVDSDTVGAAIKRANQVGVPVFTADIAANSGDVIDHPKVTSVQDRTRGFLEEIEKYPKIKVVARPSADGMRSTAMSVMEKISQSNPDIDGVFGINDDSALGALAALRQAKRTDIVVVGYDGDKEAREEILRGGPLKADAVQYPRQIGSTVIEMVVEYLNGGSVPKLVPIQVGLIDRASLQAEKSNS